MSPSLKYWDGSAWQTLTVPPGLPGATPSCKATSPISFAAADTFFRGIGVNYTMVYDDFGNSFVPASAWTCRQTGRYFLGFSLENVSVNSEYGILVAGKRLAGIGRLGADGQKYGPQMYTLQNYNAGDTVTFGGYSTGGGTATLTFEAIKLDAQGNPFPALEMSHIVGAAGEPAFAAGFANWGGGFQVAQFYKDAFGIAHITGLVACHNVNLPIFTLPVGYRPLGIEVINVLSTVGAKRVNVGADGVVALDAAMGATGQWVSLEGHKWRTT